MTQQHAIQYAMSDLLITSSSAISFLELYFLNKSEVVEWLFPTISGIWVEG